MRNESVKVGEKIKLKFRYSFFLSINIILFFSSHLLAKGVSEKPASDISPDFSQSLYLESLLNKAGRKNISNNKTWYLLLHYHKNFLGNSKSWADGDNFFLSPNGRFDPEKELFAFLKAIFMPAGTNPDNHAICRFPARFNWLKENLDIQSEKIPVLKCEKLTRHRKRFHSRRLGLVYATSSLENPASMWGHTFIKFIKSGDDKSGEPDLAITFLAQINNQMNLFFVLKGIFGGFQGKIETYPFYAELLSYTIKENRNLWELELDFTQKEIDRLIDHLWEWKSTFFDYYFIGENCAYYNLYLLNVARPSLDLADSFFFQVFPKDTIIRLLRPRNIIKKAVFFPSNIKKYKQGYFQLNKVEKKVLDDLLTSGSSGFKFTGENDALVVDTAIRRFLLEENLFNNKPDSETREKLKSLVQLQSRLGLPKQKLVKPDYTNPSLGHKTSASSMSYGFGEKGIFLSIFLRPNYSDFLDSPLGYSQFSHLSFFSLEARYYTDESKKNGQLEYLNFLDISSLSPWEAGLFPLSWGLKIGLYSLHKEFPEYSGNLLSGYLNYDLGLSFQFHFLPGNFLLYALGNLRLESSKDLKNNYRLGPGVSSGILWHISNILTFHGQLTYLYFLASEKKEITYIENGINLLLASFLALEGKYSYFLKNGFYDATLGFKFYF